MSTDLLTRRHAQADDDVLIDPRLQARRVEVARRSGRKRLRRLAALLLVLAVLAAGFGLSRSSLLDVDRVEVRGATRTGTAAVLDASGLATGQPMVSVDPAAAAARLEDLPWVAEASVSRGWPGTVTVQVVERTAVAVVGSGRRAALVDRTGRVLGPATSLAALPGIDGTAPAAGERLPARLRPLLATLAELPPALAADVVEAAVEGSGIVLELGDGIIVAWGSPGRAEAKAEALRLLFAQADRPTIERIDVSVPSAPALTRRSGAA